MTLIRVMNEEQAVEFAAALQEAKAKGFGLWHLGAWPEAWQVTLYDDRNGGQFTKGRSGDNPADAVRACLAQPNKTPNEERAEQLGKDLSALEILRARVTVKVGQSDRLFNALDALIEAL